MADSVGLLWNVPKYVAVAADGCWWENQHAVLLPMVNILSSKFVHVLELSKDDE